MTVGMVFPLMGRRDGYIGLMAGTPMSGVSLPLLAVNISTTTTTQYPTPDMRPTLAAALAAIAAHDVAGHALFQQLWVDGTDYIRSPIFLTLVSPSSLC